MIIYLLILALVVGLVYYYRTRPEKEIWYDAAEEL